MQRIYMLFSPNLIIVQKCQVRFYKYKRISINILISFFLEKSIILDKDILKASVAVNPCHSNRDWIKRPAASYLTIKRAYQANNRVTEGENLQLTLENGFQCSTICNSLMIKNENAFSSFIRLLQQIWNTYWMLTTNAKSCHYHHMSN